MKRRTATNSQYQQLVKYLNNPSNWSTKVNRPGVAAPTLDMFSRGRGGWAKEFVKSLVQGEPQMLPEGKNTDETSRQAIYNAAKAQGFVVKTLNFNSKIWACRVDGIDGEDDTDD